MSYVSDASWVLTLALNSTMTIIVNSGDISKTNCENVPGSLENLERFNHKYGKMGCIIGWNLNNTNFSGVSVSTSSNTYASIAMQDYNVGPVYHMM